VKIKVSCPASIKTRAEERRRKSELGTVQWVIV
jgi:hypothetical protein